VNLKTPDIDGVQGTGGEDDFVNQDANNDRPGTKKGEDRMVIALGVQISLS
jgi:hypothetical protein